MSKPVLQKSNESASGVDDQSQTFKKPTLQAPLDNNEGANDNASDNAIDDDGSDEHEIDNKPQVPIRRSLSVGCREITEADYDSIVKQVEFYFSEHNLPYDVFMKNLIRESKNVDDPELSGWIPLTTILTFNRMKKWRPIDKVADILVSNSQKLQISPNRDFIRPVNMEEIDFFMDKTRMKQFFDEQCSRSCVLNNFYLDEEKESGDAQEPVGVSNLQTKNLEQVESYLTTTFPQFDFKQIRLKYKHKRCGNNGTSKIFGNNVVLELNDEAKCTEFVDFVNQSEIMHNGYQLQCTSKRHHDITRASTKRVTKRFQGHQKITPKSLAKRRLSNSA